MIKLDLAPSETSFWSFIWDAATKGQGPQDRNLIASDPLRIFEVKAYIHRTSTYPCIEQEKDD